MFLDIYIIFSVGNSEPVVLQLPLISVTKIHCLVALKGSRFRRFMAKSGSGIGTLHPKFSKKFSN